MEGNVHDTDMYNIGIYGNLLKWAYIHACFELRLHPSVTARVKISQNVDILAKV